MPKFLLEWLLILASAGLFILSDSLAADWGKHGDKASLILLFLIPPIGYMLFAKLNSMQSLSVSSGIVNMILLAGTVTVGVLIFKDVVTARQWVGLCFALVAVVLLV